MAKADPPVAQIDWKRSVRIVPSRYPPVGVFDRVADPADLAAVFTVEALTNDRLRDAAGDIRLVAPEDRISGPGTTPIMAAFTHPNPAGSRFSDGSFGVYYAGESMDTAIAESRYHRERFMAFSAEPAMRLEMRAYYAKVRAELHDLRGQVQAHPEWFDPDPAQYAASQALGLRLRGQGSNGVIYPSVRRAGGECIGAFRPRVMAPVTQGPHFLFVWDGEAITDVLQVRRVNM